LLVEEEQKKIIANNGKGKEAMTEEGIITSHQSRWSIENIENILEADEKNLTKKARFRGNRQWEFWRI